MRMIPIAGVLIAALATPALADRPLDKETVIAFAGGGGLRSWQAGPPGSSILYVRNRREQWYEVTLTGPCTTDTGLDRLSYTTDTAGTFDTFSRVSVGRYPNRVCGVKSIKTSLPPKGQPGAAKR